MASKFKLTNSNESPENLDYDIYGLHKKRTIVKGELVKVEYYKNYDGSEYSDLVLIETRIFNRNEIGLALTRDQNVKWYLDNDKVGCEKNSVKFYSPQESIDEGISRRGNVFAEAKIYLLSKVGQMHSFDFLLSVKTQMDYYIQGYRQPLIDAVNSSSKPYLSDEIKSGLVNILNF